MRCLGVLLATFALGGCGLPLGAAAWLESKLYSGDGHVSTCSTLFAAGYFIDFPPFDPTKPSTVVYRLSHVPQVWRAPRFCMKFHSQMWPTDQEETRLTPVLHVRITDSRGRVQAIDISPSVVSPTVSLSFTTAGWGQSSPDLFSICGPTERLHFARGETYSMSVSYTPGAALIPAKEAYFEIEDCASY